VTLITFEFTIRITRIDGQSVSVSIPFAR